MGLLLAFMFLMNMVASILVLPILIDIIKPKDIFSSLAKEANGKVTSETACAAAAE
jgi:hypothetical protein